MKQERHVPGEFMLKLTAPAAVEFVLGRYAPLDDRNHIGVVVGVQQIETNAVVEASVYQFFETHREIVSGFVSI